jgi:outer membrane protein insertion porin family
VRAPVAPERPERLRSIRIAGNRAIASDALEPALALHAAIDDGATVDPYLVTLDADRIRAAYLKRGFFAAEVTPDVRHEAGGQVVVFTVVEGRRAVSRIEITGLPPELPATAARGRIPLGDGAPFDYDAYDAARQPLTRLVENAGYAHAEVRGTVAADPVTAVAAVRYEIVPGVRCTFGEIRISGDLDPQLAEAVRARLRFARGDRYSARALAESEAEIYDLGRFSEVRVTRDRRAEPPEDPGAAGAAVPAAIDVNVELVEAKLDEVHFGAGVGYEPVTYEVRFRPGVSIVPEGHPLLTLGLDARLALTVAHSGDTGQFEPKVRILGSVQRLDLWWPRLRGEVEGGLDYQTVEAYTWAGAHVRLGLGSPLGPRWLQAHVGWLLEELTYMPASELSAMTIDARTRLGLVDSQRIGAYQASLVADLRDDPLEPHRGGYFAVTAAAGTPYAGGDIQYLQVTPELRGYFTLGGVVVAVRARAGQIRGHVPVTERYFSGGTSGQRGFSERQLAPRATLGAPGCADAIPAAGLAAGPSLPGIGGAGLLETGVELRRQLGSPGGVPVGANIFLDGADVTCTAAGVDPARLHWAAGAGVWGKLGGLKIRSDLGYRLNRKGPGELSGGTGTFDDFAWHLGVGETY